MESQVVIYFIYFVVWFVGLIFGSFATMASYRIPLGEDLVFKRSHCPNCKHSLSSIDLIPLFSWLIQKGRCRYCNKNIKFRYPLTELTSGLMFVLLYHYFGFSWLGFVLLYTAVCLLIMIVIDFEYKIIPDSLQIALIPSGIAYVLITRGDYGWLLIGPLSYLGFAFLLRYGFYLWKKKEGLGMGDVKFFGVVGFYIDIYSFAPFLFVAGILGVVTSIFWKMIVKDDEFPFAPALAMSLFVCLIFKENITHFVTP